MKTLLKLLKGITVCAMMVLALSLYTSYAMAQTSALSPYTVKLYSYENGLPTGEANAILQTKDGHIWIGSYGGLFRYDSYEFVKMSGKGNGLTSYSIRSLYEDKNGVLWVGSDEQGPFYYKDGVFHHVGTSQEEESTYESVRCMLEDDYGRIWLGTVSGLAYIENGTIHGFSLAPEHNDSTVYTLSLDENGMLYAIDNDGALVVVDTNEKVLKDYVTRGTFWDSSEYAYSAIYMQGHIYVGTNLGNIVDLSFTDKYTSKENLTCEILTCHQIGAVNCATIASDGSIWFAGDAGVARYSNHVLEDLSYLNYAEHIVGIAEDYEHNIWLSSSKHGILHVQHVKIESLAYPEKLENLEIYTVCAYKGKWYIGKEDGILVLDENFHEVTSPLLEAFDGKNIPVHHMIEGQDGKLYIGTYYYGIYIYDESTGEIENLTPTGNKVRTLLALKNGDIAVGTQRSVELIHDGAITETISTDWKSVLCLCEAEDGAILCGTSGYGILKVAGNIIMPYCEQEDGLSGNVILRIVKDSTNKDQYWVSCGNDVFYGNSQKFEKTMPMAFGSGSILDMYVTGDTVWLFRSSGILKVDKSEFLKPEASNTIFPYFSYSDGLPGPLVANSFSWLSEEYFVICTSNGIGVMKPNSYYQNTILPRLGIDNIVFSDGTIWDGKNQIRLNKNLSKMTIYMSALTYAGENSVLEYWLEGFDAGPIRTTIGNLNEVTYTNLKAGDYAFHFCVYNNDNTMSEALELAIAKNPSFRETIWFPILIFLLACSLAAVIAATLILNSKRKQKLYKTLTDETISVISGVIDAKDPYTRGHSQRVADISVRLGKEMGLSKDELERLYYIALLHDVGKIGVPDEILKKPERLTDEEFQEIKLHTEKGGEILEGFTALKGVQEGALYHHERYDGNGYLHGLKGEEIPLFARIIGVADAYDAMSSSRCYRKALPTDVILGELEKGRNKQFDARIADIAIRIIRDEEVILKK